MPARFNIGEAKVSKATLQIGRQGATPSIVEEIKDQVEKRGFVKIKASPDAYGSIDRKDFFQRLAGDTGLRLVEVRGNTAILAEE